MEQEALRRAEKAPNDERDDLCNCEAMKCYVFSSGNVSIEFLNCATLLQLLHSDTLCCRHIHFGTETRKDLLQQQDGMYLLVHTSSLS